MSICSTLDSPGYAGHGSTVLQAETSAANAAATTNTIPNFFIQVKFWIMNLYQCPKVMLFFENSHDVA